MKIEVDKKKAISLSPIIAVHQEEIFVCLNNLDIAIIRSL